MPTAISAPPARNGNTLPIRLLIAIPPQTTNTPSAVVNKVCPAPANPVIVSVLALFQFWARAAATNGSQ